MNGKTCRFLRILISNPGKLLRLEDLASELNVSVRMIRNYCADVRAFVGTNEFERFFFLESSGAGFTGTYEDALILAHKVRNIGFYHYKLSSEERRRLIGLLLLFSDMPVTIGALADLFYASRGTLLNDIDAIRAVLEPYHIRFSQNKSQGLYLCGRECDRREALYIQLSECNVGGLFETDTLSCDVLCGFVARLLRLSKNRKEVESAIHQVESRLQISLNDEEFYKIALKICICLARTENGHYIEPCDTRSFSSNGLSVVMAQHIFKYLGTFQLIPENEVQQLAQFIKLCNLTCTYNRANTESLEFYFMVRDFLFEVSKTYGVNLLSDEQLNEYLVAHMLGVYHRVQNNEELQNPFTSQMYKTYEEDFAIVRQHISILEKGIHHSISDDEIAYILMHILVSLEQSYRKMPVPDVIIACNAGIATSNFLAQMVQKNFAVNIISVTSTHNIQTLLSRQHVDLIISTVPLSEVTVPWIQTSPVMSKQEIDTVQRKLEVIGRKILLQGREVQRKLDEAPVPAMLPSAMSEHTLQVHNLLCPSHILLDKTVENWKEAIITAGEPLLWDQIITVDYLSAMIANMQENGPYFVISPGIAIAHAHPSNGVSNIGMTLMRLKTPISFGHPTNDPVRFVATVSMFDTVSHINVLFQLMNILCNQEILDKLSAAATPEEVQMIIRSYEKQLHALIPTKP